MSNANPRNHLVLRIIGSMLLFAGVFLFIVWSIITAFSQNESAKEDRKKVEALILVNHTRSLPDNYHTKWVTYQNQKMAKVAKDAYVKMQQDACQEETCLNIMTAYTNQKVAGESLAYANEHQTGLAFDFKRLKQNKNNDTMWKWLQENAYHYGFVTDHLQDEKAPSWHYRFVGKIPAKTMHEQHLSLEQYLESKKKEGI